MRNNDFDPLPFKIDSKKLKPLFKTKPLIHAAAIAYNWLVIIAMIYLTTSFFSVILYIVSVIVIGARMHALAILMHDAAHYRFLKNRTWNDTITNLVIMYPIFSSIDKYRKNHLDHHTNLNTEEDPDWVAKLGNRAFTFPKTKREFYWSILSYFFLYQGLMDAIWFLKRFGSGDKAHTPVLDKILKPAFYLILISLLFLFGGWKLYLLYWIVPYFSTFFMFQYIRSVAEHFGGLTYENMLTSTRTVYPSLIERFFLSPHNVGYHLEHHLYPAIPFYHLPKLHRILMENKDYRYAAHITEGYTVGLIKELSL